MVEPDRQGMTIQDDAEQMRFACRIIKASKHTHLRYVMLIAFPLQQWLRERVSMLRYKYIACLVGLHRKLKAGTNGNVVVSLSYLKLSGI